MMRATLALVGLWAYLITVGHCRAAALEPVRIGVVFSETGPMQSSEQPLLAAMRTAIDEVNESGGISGRRLEAIVRDGASDPQVAARQVQDLITTEKVNAVFACWTSACRKAVMRVIESNKSVLFYPVQYEGTGTGEKPLDPSPRVVYSGAAPNQQLAPAVIWALAETPSPKVFLIGSDYVFPRSANALMRPLIKALGGQVVGEEYQPLGKADFGKLPQWLAETNPNIILNTVNGIDNASLFEALSHLDPDGRRYLTISFSVEETQIRQIGAGRFTGRYAAWNYFHDTGNARLRTFLPSFRRYFQSDDIQTSDPVEAAYVQLKIFADAARRAGSTDPDAVLAAVRGLVVQGFQETMRVDPDNRHLWKSAQIRRFSRRGIFEPVWTAAYPIRPDAAPDFANSTSAVMPTGRPMSDADARRLLAASDTNDKINALLHYKDASPLELPVELAGRLLSTNVSWSEQALAARLLVRNGGSSAQQQLAKALRSISDRNFSLLVLLELASLDHPVEADKTLLQAIGEILTAKFDPVTTRAAISALSAFKQVPDQLLVQAASEGGSRDDPSIAVGGLRLLAAQSFYPPGIFTGIGSIVNRQDFPSAPGLSDALCQTLASIGASYISSPPAGGRDAFVQFAEHMPSFFNSRCPAVSEQSHTLQGLASQDWLRKYMPKSASDFIQIFAILVAIGLVCWVLLASVWLFIAPASGIRRFRPFGSWQLKILPHGVDWFEQLDFTRRLLQPLAARERALDSWVRVNRPALVNCALPEDVRAPYQPMLVEMEVSGARSYVVSDVGYFKTLLSDGSFGAEIIGEGGVGKTAFAAALLQAANSREFAGRECIGIFLPARTIDAPEKLESLIAAVQRRVCAELRRNRQLHAGQRLETDDTDFVRLLLSKGRLVVAVDDLPRFLNEKWPPAASLEFREALGNFFYTGRVSVATLERRIKPQLIDRPRLLTFIDSYLAGQGDGPMSEADRADLAEGIDSLFANRDRVPALFARLVGDAMLGRRREKGLVADLQLAVPDLVLELVRQTVENLPRDHHAGLDARQYWRPLGAIAWACLRRGFKVAPIGRSNAIEALRGFGDAEAIIESLCRTNLMDKTAGDKVVIASDALAEYLAALWIFEATAPDRWAEARAAIEDALGLHTGHLRVSDSARTCLAAFADVAERARADVRPNFQEIAAPISAARIIEGWLAAVQNTGEEIRVGILHSETGPMAISEKPVIEATLLAIERVNARGGVGGRRLVPVRRDGQSNPAVFAEQAAALLNDGVACIFGCWTSASRIEVVKVLDKEGGLLFYPVQYEGYEQSPHVLYFGAAPNQQLLPAVDWCISELQAKSFMLIGSDYVFPRVANEIMLHALGERKGEGVHVVREPLYVSLSDWSFYEVLESIRVTPPDVILNTINGAANIEFFWRIWELQHGPQSHKFQRMKIMSFSIGDHEAQRIGAEIVLGHHAAWNYFASLDGAANHAFLRGMRGNKGVFFPSDPAESAYTQVLAFAMAAGKLLEEDKKINDSSLREAVLAIEIDGPSGRVRVDRDNGHVYKVPRIGTLSPDGVFDVTWSAGAPIKPDPFPYPELTEKVARIRDQFHSDASVPKRLSYRA